MDTGRRPCVACPVAERHRNLLLHFSIHIDYGLASTCPRKHFNLAGSLFGPIHPPRNKGVTQDVLHFLPRFSWPEVFSNWNKVPTSITLYTALSTHQGLYTLNTHLMAEHLASILTTCIVCIRPITHQTSRGQSNMLGCYNSGLLSRVWY